MKNNQYWQERFKQLEEASHKQAEIVYSSIEDTYIQAQKEIERNINNWYVRFANNNNITMAEAKKLLNSEQLKEFKWNVQEYIKHGKENKLNEKWMKELENASAKFHISRLEALKIQTQQSLEILFGNQLDSIDKITSNTYTDNYYHTMFEMQKGFNVGFNIGTIDSDKLYKITSKPWAIDEKNFSERIWENKTKLINEVHNQLTKMCVLGKAPDNTIKYLSKKFNTSKAQAGRLVMTETAYFSSLAQKDCFKNLDVEKYEIVATLDTHTSEICREQDGKTYDMKEYEAGLTAPPFHCHCRSCIAPYFEDDYDIKDTRAARDEEGATYYVSDNIKYKDWYDKYVTNSNNSDIIKEQPKRIIKTVKTFASQSKYNKLTKEEKIKELQDILVDMNEARRKHWNLNLTSKEELNQFPQLKEMAFSVDLQGIDEKVITSMLKNYKKLGNEYYTTLNHIGIFDDTDFMVRPNAGGYAFTKAKTLTGEIHVNQKLLSNFEDYIETMKKCSKIKHISPNISPEKYQYYVFTHEFAHTIYNSNMLEKNLIDMDINIYKNFQKELKEKFITYKKNINDIDEKIKKLNDKFIYDTSNYTEQDIKMMKSLQKQRKEIFVSNYALRDGLEDEFMAECFSEAKLSKKPSKTSKEVLELIDKYFKR